MFDLQKSCKLFNLRRSESNIKSMSFIGNDPKQFVTVDFNGNLRIWDFLKKKIVFEKKFANDQFFNLGPGKKNVFLGKDYKHVKYDQGMRLRFFSRYFFKERIFGLSKKSFFNLQYFGKGSIFENIPRLNLTTTLDVIFLNFFNSFTSKRIKKIRFNNQLDHTYSIIGNKYLALKEKNNLILINLLTFKFFKKIPISNCSGIIKVCSQSAKLFVGYSGKFDLNVFDIRFLRATLKSSISLQATDPKLYFLSDMIDTGQLLYKRNWMKGFDGPEKAIKISEASEMIDNNKQSETQEITIKTKTKLKNTKKTDLSKDNHANKNGKQWSKLKKKAQKVSFQLNFKNQQNKKNKKVNVQSIFQEDYFSQRSVLCSNNELTINFAKVLQNEIELEKKIKVEKFKQYDHCRKFFKGFQKFKKFERNTAQKNMIFSQNKVFKEISKKFAPQKKLLIRQIQKCQEERELLNIELSNLLKENEELVKKENKIKKITSFFDKKLKKNKDIIEESERTLPKGNIIVIESSSQKANSFLSNEICTEYSENEK